MFKKHSISCRQQGLTLIEVVTALALLSTLLVSIMIAFGKNADRIRAGLAARRAITSVDTLLLSWAEQGVYPPAADRGELPDVPEFTWETKLVSRHLRNTLGLDIISLTVRAEGTESDGSPIISLELAVPAAPIGEEESVVQ